VNVVVSDALAAMGGDWDEAKSSVALDELPDGVLVVSLDGRVEAANRVFLDLAGRTSGQLLGQRFEALVAEEDMLSIVGFQAMFGERSTRDNNVSFTTADGERRSLIVCSVRSRDERHVVMTARASGIVQQELADASRWVAEEQDRSLDLARARDALAAKNAALSAAQAELEAAYAKLKNETFARERLENELRLAQRLESIGQLAAGIAHEINTPMQYIGDNVHFLTRAFEGISSFLKRTLEALGEPAAGDWAAARGALLAAQKKARLQLMVDEVPRALEATKDGIQHVSKIVQAMKSFAHQDRDEKTPSDINRTLIDTLTVAQNEYKHVAVVHTELGELPNVLCFAGKLNQVFLNLLVNAAHAISDANRAGSGVIGVASRVVDGQVEVRISDNGCGIPPEIGDRVFDQFFTTKDVGRGSGQGLSLARRIVVDAHGGTLTFESTPGVGTTFIVKLPVSGSVG
jgi:PAS domain S-box-containing protein